MKKVLSLTLGSILALAANNALAAHKGTVTFDGIVIADTCNINVNGSNSATTTVQMPAAYKTDFTGAGSVGATQQFQIALSNCDGAVKNINMKFNGDKHSADTANETLKTTGPANNGKDSVGIKLYSKHQSAEVAVKFDNSRPDFAADAAMTGGAATLTYIAKTVQVGSEAPVSGTYTANADYELVYR